MSNNTKSDSNGYSTAKIASYLKQTISAAMLAAQIEQIMSNYITIYGSSEVDINREYSTLDIFYLTQLRNLFTATALENGENMDPLKEKLTELF